MRVSVCVDPGAGEPPPDGTPVTVEVRDVSIADAPSVTIARAQTVVGVPPAEHGEGAPSSPPAVPGSCPDTPGTVAVVEIDVDDELLAAHPDLTVWARVDASGQPRVASGDWITTRSYPVRPGDETVEVEVRPI